MKAHAEIVGVFGRLVELARIERAPTPVVSVYMDRVIAARGHAEPVDAHVGLAAVGGVAAMLRYPL